MTSSTSTASLRGILDPTRARNRFELTRHAPADDLARVVERHWIVRFDLRGREPYTQQLIPHPCVNMVFERGRAGVYGISTRRSEHLLEGEGIAVGTKFRPGGFHGFVATPIWRLTDRALSLEEAFDVDGEALGREVLAGATPQEQIAVVEAFLRERLPDPDPNTEVVARVVRQMLDAPPGTRVADVAARHGMSQRTLQRLFRRYVGVSPKWVLTRYRLHEAAERMAEERGGDWAAMALELGYFDQAHFIKDFRALVGRSPVEYAAACAAT